jgi:IS30 family transposase
MSINDQMTVDERRKYLRKMQKRYRKADRRERGHLLDEMEAVLGQHRKSLIRHMSSSLERKPRRRQRGRTYGADVDDALRVIAESVDYICAERLTPSLPWLARHLAAHGEIRISSQLLDQLERISTSTVKRILARILQDMPRLPRRGPKRANSVTRDVPMTRIPWNQSEPGHFEADLVHHCGPSAAGEYVCTTQLVDVATGWSERTAVLGRSQRVMSDAFQRIDNRLPFPILEIHPDNGSEFFNHHMVRFWKDLFPGVHLSRSRPYHKQDNRIVEQKNSTLVRAYFGTERLDTVAQTLALNQLYDKMWLFYNFFQPVMRLTEKEYLRKDGRLPRLIRRYDKARTPFDRLCATNAMCQERRTQLEALRSRTNPRQLRKEIYDSIGQIFSQPGATPGVTEDVHLTLSTRTALNSPDCFLYPAQTGAEHKDPRKERTSPVTLSLDLTTTVR